MKGIVTYGYPLESQTKALTQITNFPSVDSSNWRKKWNLIHVGSTRQDASWSLKIHTRLGMFSALRHRLAKEFLYISETLHMFPLRKTKDESKHIWEINFKDHNQENDFCLIEVHCWITDFLIHDPKRGSKMLIRHLSHETNPALLFIESWFFNRDPYSGLWNNPHITG